eukprot:6270939-Amphidinium_carterae.1
MRRARLTPVNRHPTSLSFLLLLLSSSSAHAAQVRTVAVDPSNEWFASSGNDRLIKIWDLASGTLKLSLTGHVSTVRALAISDRHPYLFSASICLALCATSLRTFEDSTWHQTSRTC